MIELDKPDLPSFFVCLAGKILIVRGACEYNKSTSIAIILALSCLSLQVQTAEVKPPTRTLCLLYMEGELTCCVFVQRLPKE